MNVAMPPAVDCVPTPSLPAQSHYLASEIAAAARAHPGANVVCLFGPAEAADAGITAPDALLASLHAIVAREYCLYGCGLVYIPLLPRWLDDDTLAILLDSLVSWLRPGGEVILCAPLTTPGETARDPGIAGGRQVRSPESLLWLARHIDNVSARLHRDPQDNLRYLHLRHH